MARVHRVDLVVSKRGADRLGLSLADGGERGIDPLGRGRIRPSRPLLLAVADQDQRSHVRLPGEKGAVER